MKLSLKTILVLFSAVCTMPCQALAEEAGVGQKGQPQQEEEAAKDCTQSAIQLLDAAACPRGIVEVSFCIGSEGDVDILEIKSNNPALIKYVAARLEPIKLSPEEYQTGKIINYRLSFGRQA